MRVAVGRRRLLWLEYGRTRASDPAPSSEISVRSKESIHAALRPLTNDGVAVRNAGNARVSAVSAGSVRRDWPCSEVGERV